MKTFKKFRFKEKLVSAPNVTFKSKNLQGEDKFEQSLNVIRY